MSACLYEIYQLNEDRMRDLGFRAYSETRPPRRADYSRAYIAELETELMPGQPMRLLDLLYKRFNVDHPIDFHGHSLSMSDVVVLNRTDAYYCDRIGWQQITWPATLDA